MKKTFRSAHLETVQKPGFSKKPGFFLWHAALVLICTVAFLLIALISGGIFERVPHVEDEAAYLFQAQVFAQGRLSVPTPPYPSSYWSPFVLDYEGRRFGKYPPGYPLLLSLGVSAGQPWIVNALLGSLTLWLVAQAGRMIYSPTAGLLAAALGLSCPVFLALSSTLLSHTTALCFTALFLWAIAGLIEDPAHIPRRYAVMAGVGLGYVLITRPFDAVGIGLPFAAYGLARALRGDRALLDQGVVATAVVLLFALMLPVYWYLMTGSAVNPYRLLWPYDRPGFGPDVGVGGHTLEAGLFDTRLNLDALARAWLGWPGYANLVFLFLPFIFRPGERWNYLLLAGFASLVDLHLAYWFSSQDAGFPRYYYAALPMLLMLAARGIELLSEALGRLAASLQKSPRAASLPLYLILVALVLYNGLVFLPPNLAAFRGKYGVSAAPLQVVRQAGVKNAIVFVRNYEHWHDFAVFFAANSPTLDSDVVYAVYRNQAQAQTVRTLYAGRQCYVQAGTRLQRCSF